MPAAPNALENVLEIITLSYSLINDKTVHLTHLEELILKKGKDGYTLARKFIHDLLNHLMRNFYFCKELVYVLLLKYYHKLHT